MESSIIPPPPLFFFFYSWWYLSLMVFITISRWYLSLSADGIYHYQQMVFITISRNRHHKICSLLLVGKSLSGESSIRGIVILSSYSPDPLDLCVVCRTSLILTHQGRVTHESVCNSGHNLSPVWHQTVTWHIVDLLSVGTFGYKSEWNSDHKQINEEKITYRLQKKMA